MSMLPYCFKFRVGGGTGTGIDQDQAREHKEGEVNDCVCERESMTLGDSQAETFRWSGGSRTLQLGSIEHCNK